MTLVTASATKWGVYGGPHKVFNEASNGDYWLSYVTDDGRIRFMLSSDQGATWAPSSSSALGAAGEVTGHSSFIDADGFMHVSWVDLASNPQRVRYARGVIDAEGDTWKWKSSSFAPALGTLSFDSDVVAWRRGTGWDVWVTWNLHAIGARASRISVDAAGTQTIEQLVVDPGNAAGIHMIAGLEFAHLGDGLTPTTTPHLFLYTGAVAHDGPGDTLQANAPIRVHRATYSNGTWSFGNSALLETGLLHHPQLVGAFDGTLLCVAWTARTSNLIRFATWSGTSTTVTRKDPPAPPAGLGTTNGLALIHDPTTHDIVLVMTDVTTGDLRFTRLRRATNTWDPWVLSTSRGTTWTNSHVQGLRHAGSGVVDAVFLGNTGISHTRIVSLERSPSAPTLVSPGAGASVDLNNGEVFSWRYNKVNNADSQLAWAFRRTNAAGLTEWWNAAQQVWKTAEVLNPGAATSLAFNESTWPSGVFAWAMRTRSATGIDSPYSAPRTLTSIDGPGLDVLAPFGVVYQESTPSVNWEYISTTPQASYEIRIVKRVIGVSPSSTAVWSTGVVSVPTQRSQRIEAILENGTTYRAYVRVTNKAGLSSGWRYSDFTISVVPPQGPTFTVSSVTTANGLPRAQLNLSGRSNFMAPEQSYGQVGWETTATVGAETAYDPAAAFNPATAWQHGGLSSAGILGAQPADEDSMLEESLLLTSAAAGTVSARTALGAPPPTVDDTAYITRPLSFPVQPGQPYAAVAHMRAGSASRSGRVLIQWFNDDDGSGTLISTTTGTTTALTTTGYTAVAATGTAPLDAKLGRVVVEGVGATAAGEVFYATRMSFHPGSVTTWQPGGYSKTQSIRAYRSTDGGATWKYVGRVATNTYQQAVLTDRTMPLNRSVLYAAYTDVDAGLGRVITSAPSPVVDATIIGQVWSIRDPDDDSSEVLAYVTDHTRKDGEKLTVTRTAGRVFPVVDSEGSESATGSLTVYVPRKLLEATLDVVQRPKTLIVQSPGGEVIKARFQDRTYDVEGARDRVLKLDYLEME